MLIVSNLLKEKLAQEEIIIQPVLNNILTKCPNLRYLAPNIQNINLKPFNPNLANANMINPNFVNSKLISPNIVNVNRNLMTPNIVIPNQVSPRIVTNNVIPTNIPNNIERGTLLRALKLLGNDLC